jgi:SAM-dependent methyltransferase
VRSVAATLGIDNVEAQVGDVHDLSADDLGGPFDVAYTRCFLMHQPDPARTLERIASLLRPGGWIVAHEPLRTPPPRAAPSFEPLARAWYLLHDVAEQLGVPHDSIDALPMHARALGLEVVEMNGFCNIVEPALGFGLHAGTTAAVRERAVSAGVASGDEVDALVRELRAAGDDGHAWVTTPFFFALTLRAG